jgi:hypothetical protein
MPGSKPILLTEECRRLAASSSLAAKRFVRSSPTTSSKSVKSVESAVPISESGIMGNARWRRLISKTLEILTIWQRDRTGRIGSPSRPSLTRQPPYSRRAARRSAPTALYLALPKAWRMCPRNLCTVHARCKVPGIFADLRFIGGCPPFKVFAGLTKPQTRSCRQRRRNPD